MRAHHWSDLFEQSSDKQCSRSGSGIETARVRGIASRKYPALLFAICVIAAVTAEASATVYELTSDWSDVTNPNGAWCYRQDGNPLPQVAAWQTELGGWSVAQPGWAASENGNNRLPFWLRSNGSETFAHDWTAGDVVVHSTDGTNGVGNGVANVTWTSPVSGIADLSGAIWMGRDIGRSNHWRLTIGGVVVTEGDVASGDAYDRLHPFDFASGSGGAAVLNDIPVVIGTVIALEIEATSSFGDFVGLRLNIDAVPEPSTAILLLTGTAALCVRRASFRPNRDAGEFPRRT